MAVDMDFEHQIYRNAQPAAAPAGGLFDTFADQVQRRALVVADGRVCVIPPTDLQKSFLRMLMPHQGIRRAVVLEAWVARLNISERKVRDLVQSLRQDFGIAIGTSRDAEHSGYYLIETREEFEANVRLLRLQAVTILRVVTAMSGGRDSIDSLLQQLRLDLELQEVV